jgi:ATP-binding cassette, subfamily B, bacterial CvaB/MchF/RaxB
MISPMNFWKKRPPLILQTEAAECGLACLASIANFHGNTCDLISLRARFDISLKGSSLGSLIQLAEAIGLNSRPVRAELSELQELQLPAILHWDLNHFVVLERISKHHLHLLDPACGEKSLPLSEATTHFTGVALELFPKSTYSAPIPMQRLAMRSLLQKIIGIKSALLSLFCLALLLQLMALATPFFMQVAVDTVVVSEDKDLLTALGLGFLLLALIQPVIGSCRQWFAVRLSQAIEFHLQNNLFSHLLHLPLAFFEKRQIGDIISRFDSLKSVQTALTQQFIESILDGVLAFFTLIMLGLYSPPLSLIVLAAIALYAGLRAVSYRPLRQAGEQDIVTDAKKHTYFLESTRAIQSIKTANNVNRRANRYNNLLVENQNAQLNKQKITLGFNFGNQFIFGLENVLVTWIGISAILAQELSLGVLFAFLAYKRQFTNHVSSLIDNFFEFKMLDLHLQRISDIALSETERNGVQNPNPLSLALSLEQVGFRYGFSEPFLFRNLSLQLAAGETLAIVGPSGMGKSTIIKLLLGLLTPTEGAVHFGGQDLALLDKNAYRNCVAAVTPEDQLISGSITDNIVFGDEQPDNERLLRAAQCAAIHQEILAMPMGYHTLAGDMGAVLSSGQKQRILIARALYREPKIIILDEATSHLDINNEKKILANIKHCVASQLLVAHRPHTIASADRVVRLTPQGFVYLTAEEAIAATPPSQAAALA